MKYLTTSVIVLLLISASVKAQSKYAIAYAYSSVDKVIYISSAINCADYKDCKDENGYNSTISPARCIEREYLKVVKISAGRKYSNYTIRVQTHASNDNGYNTPDTFDSELAATEARRNILSKYTSQGYSYITLGL